MKIDLCGSWKLYFYDRREQEITQPEELEGIKAIPCTVPGNVELDLVNAGMLPEDLFKGENILEAEKYETYDWWYETAFSGFETEKRILLKFEGVDCIAEYFLNGEKIGTSDNMLIPVSFDITDKIRSGENKLYVHISSALLAENDMETTAYSAFNPWRRSGIYSAQVRKAPHSYGWDIMPRAISAGIWRGVLVETEPECMFNQFYIITDLLKERAARLQCMYDIKLPARYYGTKLTLNVQGACGESRFDYTTDIRFKAGNEYILVENPKLWWPYGYGEPNLYAVTASLYSDGTLLAQKNVQLGIRTVELIRRDCIEGGENCFRFRINHTDVMCKGSNWVPLDAYHSRDAARYEKALALVKDIGCNILRCWGGNVYEDTYFYDFCDRNGVMIWQDFSMACALYPQTEAFYQKIKLEAETVVKKLRQHPCVILWSGDNECDMIQMGEGESLNPNKVNKITREILPGVIFNQDKGRPYLESSPFVSDIVYESRDCSKMPEDHLWGPRDYFKSDYYKRAKAHFVSETGYHGCPVPESVRKFIDEEFLWPCTDNRQWTLHSSDQNGNPSRIHLMIDQIRQLFGTTMQDLESFSLASQISQAEAKKYFIERVRIQTPKSGGVIWWNLLDGWPQFSDAVVDYYFEKKLAYSVIKRSQAPFCLICGENTDSFLPVYAVNDTLEVRCGAFCVSDGETGESLLEGTFSIPANERVCLGRIPADYSEKRLLLLNWDGGKNHCISGMVPFDFERVKKWYALLSEE